MAYKVTDLPKDAQIATAKQFIRAQKSLYNSSQKYQYTSKFFDWGKFVISTINDRGENLDTKYKIIFDEIEKLLQMAAMDVSATNRQDLFDYYVSTFHDNANITDKKIEKIDLINPLINKVVSQVSSTHLAEIIMENELDVEMVQTEFGTLLEAMFTDHEIVFDVLSKFNEYILTRPESPKYELSKSFVCNEYDQIDKLKFHGHEMDDLQYKIISKIVIFKIIMSNRKIHQIKEGVGI
ncbi:hypothetical protein [uncultured Fructobacillus sp.]|uniref:hypothetical protein n=1 Tax=uncultured Fructobacillus sp. TaxID=591942 RepID=UPI002591F863|nr:hypothetical protein [uncultured Fructobacillus sp.]